jgi:hypothetical protein
MKHKTRKYKGASSKSLKSLDSPKSLKSPESLKSSKSSISTESGLIETVQGCFTKDGFDCTVVDTYLIVRHA